MRIEEWVMRVEGATGDGKEMIRGRGRGVESEESLPLLIVP
jgi:hypothetical protein